MIEDKHFIPVQPEMVYKTEDYLEIKPKSKNIALYYQFKVKKGATNTFSVLPDGCFDILFCCSPSKPCAFLWTSPLKRTTPYLADGCEYFGVRFFPEQSVIKLEYSMSELLAKKIPLIDVFAMDSFIVEKIGAGKSIDERIKFFEKFIESTVSEFRYDRNIVEYSINKIYSSKGTIKVNRLSEDTGYSTRYIRNKFEFFIGFSPKQFIEIVKFQNSIDMILKTNDYKLTDIVHENGYYDQSHFIKMFKRLAHLPPFQLKKSIEALNIENLEKGQRG
ncbi:helix-turn-helix domain-containing protein [Alteribacillus sp. JSM 102045]|uniref:helix-turn-helix domain-containing protein n=1 Tax=Alteribacillus sp. JSM 102045 TaxID=1562101 RepID=UPI0035C0977A